MDSAEDCSLYALNWSYFDRNLKSTFTNMRSLKKYADVTFLCQDRTLYAHKVILHAGSNYFQELFEDRRATSNMLIYMFHVKGIVLKKLLEYLYCGEVHVEKKHLQEFIMLGQSLKVKGLVNRPEDLSKTDAVDQLQAKRRKLEECTSPKEKRTTTVYNVEKDDDINLDDDDSDSEYETEAPKANQCVETTNSLELQVNSKQTSIRKTEEPPPPSNEEEYNSTERIQFVTKSYTRYQRLAANIKKTETGKHEMTRGTRRRCGQCSIQKLEKRTRYYCLTCNIALCRECFEPFHKTFDSGNIPTQRET